MRRDLYSGLIFIALGVALLAVIVPLGIVEPRKVRAPDVLNRWRPVPAWSGR